MPARQLEEDRISAVHYLRFVLTPEQVRCFEQPASGVALRADHVRALEVAAGHVVVECVPPAPPFPELADDLAAELLARARTIAADWLQSGRASELTIDSAGPHAQIEIRARA